MNFEDSEPFFLLDENLIELEAILKDVQFKLANPDLEKNHMILRSFVKACIKTYKKPRPIPIPTLPRIKELHKEKKETHKIKGIKKVPIKKRVYPIPIPSGKKLNNFKTKIKYKREETETELLKTQIPLIQDNITNKPLAIATINDRYIVREPAIEKDQIQILKQAIEKRPEDPKKAWRLIKQLAPNLPDEKLTNIKYYLINSLFALGRLEPLLHDTKIVGIQCDGVGKYIQIRREGKLIKTNIIFKDKEDLDSFIKKVAKKFNKTLDEKNPIVDTIDRKFRFQLILGLHGATSRFTIKKLE